MIRLVVPDDIPFIIRSLQCMRAESPIGHEHADDPEYVSENLAAVIDGEGFLGYVYGEQHGYMFGTLAPTWFCKKLRAYELSLFVKPEHRGSRAAPALIKRFVADATDRGAFEIFAGGHTEIKTEKLYKLYERLGFERHGLGVRLRV